MSLLCETGKYLKFLSIWSWKTDWSKDGNNFNCVLARNLKQTEHNRRETEKEKYRRSLAIMKHVFKLVTFKFNEILLLSISKTPLATDKIENMHPVYAMIYLRHKDSFICFYLPMHSTEIKYCESTEDRIWLIWRYLSRPRCYRQRNIHAWPQDLQLVSVTDISVEQTIDMSQQCTFCLTCSLISWAGDKKHFWAPGSVQSKLKGGHKDTSVWKKEKKEEEKVELGDNSHHAFSPSLQLPASAVALHLCNPCYQVSNKALTFSLKQHYQKWAL